MNTLTPWEAGSLASQPKKQIQEVAARQAESHLATGGDPFEAVALARKLKVFATAFGEVAEAAAAEKMDHLSDPVTAHDVVIERTETVTYDYTASPAWRVLTQRIERLEAERKLVEARAKALARAFRTEAQPEHWADPETGESFEILPAARSAKPTLKASVR